MNNSSAALRQASDLPLYLLFANREYEQAEYDKPDHETFKQTYIAAYAKAQSELMVHRSSPFSITTLPSQRAANMMIDIDLYGFDMAYEWLRSGVEGAAIPQQPQESEAAP